MSTADPRSQTPPVTSRLVLPSPLAPFWTLWKHRGLVTRLARREIEARYRGSLLGLAWALATPVLMLGVYTFVFSVVFRARWGTGPERRGEFALVLFAGMLTFGLLSECANRAPGLVLENVSYVKKVVFPLEILPWVALASAAFSAGAGLAMLLLGQLIFRVPVHAAGLFLPVLLAPLCLFVLGTTWFLASAGVFLRDLRQVVPLLTTALLFLSPVFYPVSAVPEGYRHLLALNPVTGAVVSVRDALFLGQLPDWRHWLLDSALSAVVCWLGFAWFANTRKGFADVL